MAFGERFNPGLVLYSQALNVNTAAAQGHAVTESAATTGHPIPLAHRLPSLWRDALRSRRELSSGHPARPSPRRNLATGV